MTCRLTVVPQASASYLVTFRGSAVGCVYSATLATVEGIAPAGDQITVAPEGTGVRVRTFAGGVPTGSSFHLIVVCS